MAVEPRVAKAIKICQGYEGLSGLRADGRYYPEQLKADKAGVITIGKGHVLSEAEKKSGRFNKGLTLAEVDELFASDLAPRIERLTAALGGKFTDDQFSGALSMFYNIEVAWTPHHSPYDRHRAGHYKAAAEGMLKYLLDGHNKPCLGLWRRRMSEALCYMTGEVMIAKEPKAEKALEARLHQVLTFTRPPVLH